MNQPRLEWYITIVEAGGISKAASAVFASQQSVSSYVKRLESFYGITLFDRSHGFSLTPQGKALYDYAKKAILREQELIAHYQAIKQNRAGRIRFGLSLARSQMMLPKVIPTFHERYPSVKVLPREAATAVLVKLLSERKINLYYGKDFDAPSGILKEVLLRERLYLIITDELLIQFFGGDLAQTIQFFSAGVALKQLSGLPFVSVDSSGKTTRPIDVYCRKNGIALTSVIQANNTPLLIDLCKHNLGAGLCLEAFLPQVIQSGIESSGRRLNVFPILDNITDWNIVLAYYPDDHENEFFSFFKELIRSTVSSKRISI